MNRMYSKTGWQVLGEIYWRRFKAQSLYWLRSIGIDPNDRDIFSRLYIVYIFIIVGIWVGVSYSGLLTLAWHLGHTLNKPLGVILPPIAILAAVLSITLTVARSPLYLTHGDIEWALSSPISPRLFVPFYVIPRQIRLFLLSLLIVSLAALFLHTPHEAALAVSFALWMVTANSLGWIIAAIHYSRHARPYRYFWLAVLLSLLTLVFLFHQGVIVMAQRVEPYPSHFVELTLLLGGLWFLGFLVASHINLLSVQEASELYADIADLGTIYLPNRDLVQQIHTRKRLAKKRVIGRLPSWPKPYFEIGRFGITLLRQPRYLWTLVELSLLFRAGIVLLAKTSNHWAWLFWLFIAYRFRRGHLSQIFIEDVTNPFLYQFWPDSIVLHFIQSSILPVLIVFLLTTGFWWILPLSIPLTGMDLLFVTSLILSWVLGEATALMKSIQSKTAGDNYHVAAVMASGLVLLLATVLHHIAWAPLIPLVLMTSLWRQYQTEKPPLRAHLGKNWFR
ncbi:hypothetical protein [Sulfobacillus thermosulfidooxidans]|uniref:hypothetical protein n=1 Tax=Sulfobacillus thermosulfidooxidans TaxID=28034 RepID=UPI00035C8893|nr:hypothetical protein [Sulfobacillus thermosulfidooxidans]